MSLFLWGLVIIFVGGLASLISGRRSGLASFFGAMGAVAGSITAIIPAFKVLLHGITESFRLNWSIPFGSFFVQIDALSAVFLIPIFGLSAVAAIYGAEYLLAYREKKNLGVPWFFYNLLLIGMALVVVAKNGLLFLVAWEIMSLSSFFLVAFEYERQTVRQAGLIYLIAMHIGTAFLVVFFILLGHHAGSLDFDKISGVPSLLANILFLLAIVGFGTKAGFMPLHVWLPYAHPAAPSHVSAVMSGVMIKTGIYGLVRALTLLGMHPAWWCWLLISIGALSGVLGVLFALAQHDLKRLLAYHSVENIGIITIGLGVGLLGINMNSPTLAVLGFAGGLFHVINHAVFKGLLFLGAGAVLHSCKTGHIDLLGGIIKRMPWTAFTFLVGSIAICGLPPLNGFVSEFLIYLGVFKNGIGGGLEAVIFALIVIGSLALIGGLALACFAKAFGVIFLGHPRSDYAQHTHEVRLGMKFSMATLAVFCVLLGIFSPLVIKSAENVILEITSLQLPDIRAELASASTVLWNFVFVSLILFGMISGFSVLRKLLLRGRSVRETVTWDCGYAQPSPKMQYTATSFAQPLTDLFNFFLRTRKDISHSKGIFPAQSTFHTDTSDIGEKYIYQPAYRWISLSLSKLRWLQHGRLQIYVLYIALTLWILLIWKLM
ncbi:MAG: proton-conducting transporter membrane subunit [Phycisphaerae bacterium]|jgi:formate hydrogenlyase subunit 3/multisubunit Na+/H+ antiporter MnhD subunit